MANAILDEIRSDTGPTRCGVCIWLETQSAEDRRQWQEAMDDKSYSRAAIERAIARRLPEGKTMSVENHRNKGHKV